MLIENTETDAGAESQLLLLNSLTFFIGVAHKVHCVKEKLNIKAVVFHIFSLYLFSFFSKKRSLMAYARHCFEIIEKIMAKKEI